MIQKIKGLRANANLTVECALIMPMILLVIISIIWLMIYLYDGLTVQKALVHAVIAADYRVSKSNGELMKEIEERINEALEGQIVGCEEPVVSVKVSKYSVSAKVETKLNIPLNLPGISKLTDLKAEIKKRRLYGADLIYDVKRIKAIAEFLKENEEGDGEGEN
ncbi:MAG: pilus assembly protein [Lachnospiraceae bacterium]|nr:pilus assembly protein [Lachnospiraceae bacterium]